MVVNCVGQARTFAGAKCTWDFGEGGGLASDAVRDEVAGLNRS